MTELYITSPSSQSEHNYEISLDYVQKGHFNLSVKNLDRNDCVVNDTPFSIEDIPMIILQLQRIQEEDKKREP